MCRGWAEAFIAFMCRYNDERRVIANRGHCIYAYLSLRLFQLMKSLEVELWKVGGAVYIVRGARMDGISNLPSIIEKSCRQLNVR